MKRSEYVKKFLKGRIKQELCSCCKRYKIITIRFGEDQLCLKCLKGIIFFISKVIRNQLPQHDKYSHTQLSISKKVPYRSEANLTEQEIREMGHGSKLAPTKGLKKRGRAPASGFNWGESEVASKHFAGRMEVDEE